jgi:N-hydroxyarylamine O-acetyltransferase
MRVQYYLERINYFGPTVPAADVLRDLHLAHLQSVPFENLDIHLGRPITLSEAYLYEKIVVHRRGGFCYELNGLFAWLLRELGFDVTLLSSRVFDGEGAAGPEFDHLALRVTCPADAAAPTTPWLADVGFGDSFRLPLRLDQTGRPQHVGQGAYRIAHYEEDLLLQREMDGAWVNQYSFSRQPRQLAEFAPMCHFHQSSPDSHFTRQRICSLATENGRITLSDERLIETTDGKRRERAVSEDEYRSILAAKFGISLP